MWIAVYLNLAPVPLPPALFCPSTFRFSFLPPPQLARRPQLAVSISLLFLL